MIPCKGDDGSALALAQAEASAAKVEAAEAQASLEDIKAKLASAEVQVNRVEEARVAAEARAIEDERSETAVVSKAMPTAVVAADPGESHSVQFSLIAGAVEFQVLARECEAQDLVIKGVDVGHPSHRETECIHHREVGAVVLAVTQCAGRRYIVIQGAVQAAAIQLLLFDLLGSEADGEDLSKLATI